MSRLTGTDAYGLMEAYNNVYAPQELTEEQVWEEVETWVNSLVEEGYDLSDYTWEEMYESYLEEQGRSSGSSPGSVGYKPKPMGTETGRQLNQVFGQGKALLGDTPRNTPAPGTRQNLRGGGSRPDPRAAAPQRQGPPVPPRLQQKPPAPAAPAARPSAPAPAARPPSGSAPRPAATAPASPKVAPTKPASTATPSGGSALDRATAAASKPAAFSPKPQSDVGGMIARSQARQAAQTPKPSTPTPAARPMGGARGRMLGASFDPFDVIKGHLIDEGYADTEESALVIMANMSEEWRQSIVTA